MGARFSKAARPRLMADASVAPASNHHDIDTNELSRQDLAPRLPASGPLSHDDISVATSTTPHTTLPRRNSAPFLSDSESPRALRNMDENQTFIASFEHFQFLDERGLRSSINWDIHPPPPPLAPPAVLPPPPPAPIVHNPSEQTPQCLICCNNLPKKTDLRYAKEVVKPCRSCQSECCIPCVKKMFVDACKDMARMPPRCCVPINLHHAKPHLTEAEARLFRAKYEEWSTPKPFYCPVPVCSAFIPDKLLPQHFQAKDKPRVDSGIGTPSPEEFRCPTCEAGICMQCRQPAHPGSICNINEFGLDAETAELLKSWGYKKCPKCGHGVKRMFGCNHMECRCGAHFCWSCLENIDQCNGGCYDDEDEEDEYGGEDESDISDDDEPPTNRPRTLSQGDPDPPEITTAEAATQTGPESTTPTSTPPQAISPRNLDGGGARHWANSAFNFGDEPSNDIQDRAWDCDHSFTEYKIPLATALTSPAASEMECVKCWCTVHPQLDAPQTQDKLVPVRANAARPTGVRRARAARYVPPRGLFRADATIGTAPHLRTTLSQSVPQRHTSPMQDVHVESRVVDTYGNVITTTPIPSKRRASFGSAPSQASKPVNARATSVFGAPAPRFSLAHECSSCNIVLCTACMNAALGIAQAREEAEQREAEERERREEEALIEGGEHDGELMGGLFD